jgi:hypothetical protein
MRPLVDELSIFCPPVNSPTHYRLRDHPAFLFSTLVVKVSTSIPPYKLLMTNEIKGENISCGQSSGLFRPHEQTRHGLPNFVQPIAQHFLDLVSFHHF